MKIIGIGLVLLLGGCAGLESPDPASPYYAYPPGWRVQLNRPLTIEPGAATVRLQFGQIVPRNGVQEYAAYCVVELNTVRAEPQTLQPGRFEVLRVTRSISTIAAAAAPSPFVKTAHLGSVSPSVLYYKTEFTLRDPAQPNLRSMTCSWDQMAPGYMGFMRHLTVDEMNSALGDWMRLIPPTERT
jgi:hypothetical protein